ncbi:MAG: hypothetical protein K6E37_00300 [Bacteroidales bacterium]|nr:hypothetical protein [Bacteroidales bacterium]
MLSSLRRKTKTVVGDKAPGESVIGHPAHRIVGKLEVVAAARQALETVSGG